MEVCKVTVEDKNLYYVFAGSIKIWFTEDFIENNVQKLDLTFPIYNAKIIKTETGIFYLKRDPEFLVANSAITCDSKEKAVIKIQEEIETFPYETLNINSGSFTKMFSVLINIPKDTCLSFTWEVYFDTIFRGVRKEGVILNGIVVEDIDKQLLFQLLFNSKSGKNSKSLKIKDGEKLFKIKISDQELYYMPLNWDFTGEERRRLWLANDFIETVVNSDLDITFPIKDAKIKKTATGFLYLTRDPNFMVTKASIFCNIWDEFPSIKISNEIDCFLYYDQSYALTRINNYFTENVLINKPKEDRLYFQWDIEKFLGIGISIHKKVDVLIDASGRVLNDINETIVGTLMDLKNEKIFANKN